MSSNRKFINFGLTIFHILPINIKINYLDYQEHKGLKIYEKKIAVVPPHIIKCKHGVCQSECCPIIIHNYTLLGHLRDDSLFKDFLNII